MLIRHADKNRDAAACASIYAPFVTGSVISFEADPPSAEDFARRIERCSKTHQWLVAEQAGDVCGFAYASVHRARAAYRWASEVSVYVAGAHHRRGVGRALYRTLFELLLQQGLYVAVAGITLPNEASVALHESLGFVPVGVYRGIGWKFGGWQDVSWWQLELAGERPDQPREPGPPVRLEAESPRRADTSRPDTAR